MISNRAHHWGSPPLVGDAGHGARGPQLRDHWLKPGHTLFHQGDPADLIYEVTDGVVRQERLLGNGRRQVTSFGFRGDIVGFPHLGLHAGSCRLITAASVICYRINAIDAALHQRLFAAALNEIEALQQRFQTLTCGSAMQRVTGFLLQMKDRIGIPQQHGTLIQLPMCRSDIADHLNLSAETISRILSQLRAAKVIALPEAQTVILNGPDRLSQLAEGDGPCLGKPSRHRAA
jgi:CRP-like cAMP-binding protein